MNLSMDLSYHAKELVARELSEVYIRYQGNINDPIWSCILSVSPEENNPLGYTRLRNIKLISSLPKHAGDDSICFCQIIFGDDHLEFHSIVESFPKEYISRAMPVQDLSKLKILQDRKDLRIVEMILKYEYANPQFCPQLIWCIKQTMLNEVKRLGLVADPLVSQTKLVTVKIISSHDA